MKEGLIERERHYNKRQGPCSCPVKEGLIERDTLNKRQESCSCPVKEGLIEEVVTPHRSFLQTITTAIPNPYELLKTCSLQTSSPTDTALLSQILAAVELGDRRPTDIMNNMGGPCRGSTEATVITAPYLFNYTLNNYYVLPFPVMGIFYTK